MYLITQFLLLKFTQPPYKEAKNAKGGREKGENRMKQERRESGKKKEKNSSHF